MNQVHLEKITPMNWHDVEDLHVGKDQNFLADNVSSLALAGVIREAGFHVYTFGIYLGEEPIGFAMIGVLTGRESSASIASICWSLSISVP